MGVFPLAGPVGAYLRALAADAAHELGVFAALGAGKRDAAIDAPRDAARAALTVDAPAAALTVDALAAAMTVDALAAAIGAPNPRRLRPLLDALVDAGWLARVAAGAPVAADAPVVAYALAAPVAADASVVAYALAAPAATAPLIAPAATAPLAAPAAPNPLVAAIRDDRPVAIDPAVATAYHAHLLEAGGAAARELAPQLGDGALLDLGGGAGVYTAAYLDAFPAARATLVDAPAVVALARAHLARFGDRVRFVEGDARTADAGREHSVALLANVLHLCAPDECAALCAAAARGVAPGGSVVVADLRSDSPEGIWFALDMALYTAGGDVYATAQIAAWLTAPITESRLAAAPEVVVLRGTAGSLLDARIAAATDAAWDELVRTASLVPGAPKPQLAPPRSLRAVLDDALADPARRDSILNHYGDLMPRLRVRQLASTAEPAASLFHAPLDWARLPRLARAIDRLFALLADADVPAEPQLGAPDAAAVRARTPTLAALYARTHYGNHMPLLYGTDADLAFAAAAGLDPLATIDRFLVAPIVHELSHLGRERVPLAPLHLDECVSGYLGGIVHPALVAPHSADDADTIFAAPWLAQVGAAIARAFGRRALVRAHAGLAPLPADFTAAAIRLGAADRPSLHFLSNTLDPAPWVALALAAPLPDDAAADRAITEDAIRALCLLDSREAGSYRTCAQLPAAPLVLDARTGWIATERSGVSPVAPRHWVPPAVCARFLAQGRERIELHLASLAAIPAAADALCAAAKSGEHAGVRIA
ncbi:MAG TPA: class I SAM-dependent methyltransferase [Kofleriaceae bacterium]